MKRPGTLALLTLLLACHASPEPRTERGALPRPPLEWSRSCPTIEPAPGFVRLDDRRVVARLGPPAEEERFTLGTGATLFRAELLNALPLPANAQRVVIERSWRANGCWLTLWSVEQTGMWRVLRGMRWPEGVDF